MGSKISNLLGLLGGFVVLAVSLSGNCYAFSPIPDATLQIAQTAELKSAEKLPAYDIIRVGIGSTSFGTYVYKNIGIFGTAALEIYNNGTLLQTLPANTNVNVSINQDLSYTLKKDNAEEIAEIPGALSFKCPSGLLGVKDLKRAGSQALYRGEFDIVKSPTGVQFNLVNKIPVEDYLRGVVPNEMPVRFGLEALKAQSVAARNYVLSPRVKSSPNYDVVDSVASQVYFGANSEKDLSDKAVEQTEGIVALYNWDLILAQYSSTAGGYTESYSHAFSDPNTKEFPSDEKPYLKAKPDILYQKPLNSEKDASEYYKSTPDAYDIRSPYFRWTREWQADELKNILETTLAEQSATGFVKPVFNKGDKLDDLLELKVIRRGDSGKIVEMEVVTQSQTYKIYKELVVRRLIKKDGKALPSANVVFENAQDEEGKLVSVKAFGGGFGHGVGMSQYGAGFMGSELHLPYDKILQHYYTGIILGTKPVIISGDSAQNTVMQHFYANKKFANIVVDNKFQVSKLNANINGKDYTFELPTSIFGGNRCVRINISDYIKNGHNKIVFSYPLAEGNNKGLRLFVELVERDDNDSIW